MTLKTVRAGSLHARFSAHRRKRIDGVALPLADYRQDDYHSCGFLAALTVIEYLSPEPVPMSDVLATVRPEPYVGVGGEQMIWSLAEFGISAVYMDDLNVWHLHDLVSIGVPVIISVWPYTWPVDHWTVVQGFDNSNVYLTNHYSMSLDWFQSEWIDNWGDGSTYGAGLVCRRTE